MGAKINDGLTRYQRYHRRHKEQRAASKRQWDTRNREHRRQYQQEWQSKQPAKYWLRWPSRPPEKPRVLKTESEKRDTQYAWKSKVFYPRNASRLRLKSHSVREQLPDAYCAKRKKPNETIDQYRQRIRTSRARKSLRHFAIPGLLGNK